MYIDRYCGNALTAVEFSPEKKTTSSGISPVNEYLCSGLLVSTQPFQNQIVRRARQLILPETPTSKVLPG